MLAPGAAAESHPCAADGLRSAPPARAWHRITPLQTAHLPQGCNLPGPAVEARAPAFGRKNTGTNATKEHSVETRMLHGRSTHAGGLGVLASWLVSAGSGAGADGPCSCAATSAPPGLRDGAGS